MIQVSIAANDFNPFQLLSDFQEQTSFSPKDCGANACFIGTMRDFNEGDTVNEMLLEHYPGMTEKVLRKLAENATQEFGLNHVLIHHRVGDIEPGDAIVLVSVWSAHRKASFEACRNIMETLKSSAPFWKEETLIDGTKRWVEHNTAG